MRAARGPGRTFITNVQCCLHLLLRQALTAFEYGLVFPVRRDLN